MSKLIDEFGKSLIDPSLDLVEMGIDSFIDNEIIKEIPFVNILVGVSKAGISIRDKYNAKKLLLFIKEFNSGSIDEKKLQKFKAKFESNESFRAKVVEQIMVFNDRFITEEKSKISANLLKAWIEEKINWEEFINLNISLDALHPGSFDYLNQWSKVDFEIPKSDLRSAVGFNNNSQSEAVLISAGLAKVGSPVAQFVKILDSGKKLFEYGIKPSSIDR
ncbi:hypothetical protein AAOE16_08310 [Ekhidna sp. MALMAid0563]|uniref:hypothetical protein n=1 Tax=Ekhidna sp. MALMAid0563 TaxID=3143937 RepID=UPI0032DF901E